MPLYSFLAAKKSPGVHVGDHVIMARKYEWGAVRYGEMWRVMTYSHVDIPMAVAPDGNQVTRYDRAPEGSHVAW